MTGAACVVQDNKAAKCALRCGLRFLATFCFHKRTSLALTRRMI